MNKTGNIKIKFTSLLIAIILSGNLTNAQKIAKVEIHSVPLSLETESDVPCNKNFDNDFPDLLMINKIDEQNMLSKVKKLLLTFEPITQKSIDVRGYLSVFYQNAKPRKICFDRFGDFYELGWFFKNKRLFSFLKNNNLIQNYRTNPR